MKSFSQNTASVFTGSTQDYTTKSIFQAGLKVAGKKFISSKHLKNDEDSGNTRTLNILLVEDDPKDAELLQRNLVKNKDANFVIDLASSLKQVVPRLEAKHYDVILLDLGLPESTGIETLNRVLKLDSKIPIVVLTGRDDENVALAAIRAGAQDYLVKGQWGSPAILQMIRYAIERQTLKEALEEARSGLELKVRERTKKLFATNEFLKEEIAERHKIEAELRESEQRFRRLADATFEGLLIHEKGKIIDANQSLASLLRLDISLLKGKNVSDFIEIPLNYLQILSPKVGTSERFESRTCIASGARLCTIEINSKVMPHNGGVVGVLAIRDLTDKVQCEELNFLNSNLKKSNSELEGFACIASHDLQEPLRTISMHLSLLERKYSAIWDDEGRSYITFVTEAANRMRMLIIALLEYSKISTQKRSFGIVDLDVVIAKVLQNLTVAIGDSKAFMKLASLPPVVGDSNLLMQLFQNLIANATKFRSTRPLQIEINCLTNETEGSCEFSVRDNGIGFSMTNANRIFGIFQRLHTQSEYPGAGIGLATCKRIVEDHGGKIRVESSPNQGTTFYFTLKPAKSVAISPDSNNFCIKCR